MFDAMPATDEVGLCHQVVIVESDGTIMPEESLRSTYSGRYADLNVCSVTPGTINHHPKFEELTKAQSTWSTECSDCALVRACKSGSTIGRIGMRIDENGDTLRKPVYCSSYIALYAAASAIGQIRTDFIEKVKSSEPVLTAV